MKNFNKSKNLRFLQIYFRALSDRTHSFRFKYQKRHEKWKILFCSKSMHWENSFFESNKHFVDIRSKQKFLWIKKRFMNWKKLSSIRSNFFFDRISQKCFFDSKKVFSGCARYEKNVRKENYTLQKYLQIIFWLFFHQLYIFIYSSKTSSWKSKIKFFRQNIRDTEKMLGSKIVYYKKIYNFGLEHFFIGPISFYY